MFPFSFALYLHDKVPSVNGRNIRLAKRIPEFLCHKKYDVFLLSVHYLPILIISFIENKRKESSVCVGRNYVRQASDLSTYINSIDIIVDMNAYHWILHHLDKFL
jgi:hypothetical protein